MGFVAEPSGNFDYFDGKPNSFVSNPDTGILVAEALPQSNTRRTLSVASDQDGFWTATCDTSYWDEEHRYFLMHGLTFDLGAEPERDESLRRGLHWLVNASMI